jgi:hypothetical protein
VKPTEVVEESDTRYKLLRYEITPDGTLAIDSLREQAVTDAKAVGLLHGAGDVVTDEANVVSKWLAEKDRSKLFEPAYRLHRVATPEGKPK